MEASHAHSLPKEFLSELEQRFFWWEHVGSQPRSGIRIIAQAMSLAPFKDVRRLEAVLGPHCLVDVMLNARPGWISDQSWEFWRGRLHVATGRAIPETPPRRSFDAEAF